MQPGDGLIQARLVAGKQLRLDLFLGGMQRASRLFLPLSSLAAGTLMGVMT